jgi:hypothetical protein
LVFSIIINLVLYNHSCINIFLFIIIHIIHNGYVLICLTSWKGLTVTAENAPVVDVAAAAAFLNPLGSESSWSSSSSRVGKPARIAGTRGGACKPAACASHQPPGRSAAVRCCCPLPAYLPLCLKDHPLTNLSCHQRRAEQHDHLGPEPH